MQLTRSFLILLITIMISACGGSDSGSESQGTSPTPTPDFAPSLSVNGREGNISFNMLYGVSTTIPVEIQTISESYTLELTTSEGIDASYHAGEITLITNEHSEVGLAEEVVATLTDSQNKSDELRIDVNIFEYGEVTTNEFFCFVGYCDEENPEPNEYESIDGSTYHAHYTAVLGTELVFDFKLAEGFGFVQSAAVFIDGERYDDLLEVDISTNTMRLNTRAVSIESHQASIRFLIYNVMGIQDSVVYEFRFRHVAANNVIYIGTKDDQLPLVNLDEIDFSFDLEVKEESLGGLRGKEREFELTSVQIPSSLVNLVFDISLDGNTLNIKRDESEVETNKMVSAYNIIVYARCKNCENYNLNYHGTFTFYLADDQYMYELEYYKPYKNKYAMKSGSYFEIDYAISFFETVFEMNGINLPYNKRAMRRYLSSTNSEMSKIFTGFQRTFLEFARSSVNIGDLDFTVEQDKIEEFNYTAYGINNPFSEVLELYNEDVQSTLEEHRNETDNFIFGKMVSSYRFKVDTLNTLIEEFNSKTGSSYSTINYSDIPSLPYELKNTYSFFIGNLAFGEFIDEDVFVFHEEYSYLMGINEAIRSGLR